MLFGIFLHRVFNNKTFKKLNYDNLVDIALDVAVMFIKKILIKL